MFQPDLAPTGRRGTVGRSLRPRYKGFVAFATLPPTVGAKSVTNTKNKKHNSFFIYGFYNNTYMMYVQHSIYHIMIFMFFGNAFFYIPCYKIISKKII